MEQIAGFVAALTLGDLVLAFLTTLIAREGAVALLPDRIAGPGGWLVDTERDG
jgi:hypothetical protein